MEAFPYFFESEYFVNMNSIISTVIIKERKSGANGSTINGLGVSERNQDVHYRHNTLLCWAMSCEGGESTYNAIFSLELIQCLCSETI